MFKGLVFHVKNLKQKLKVFGLGNLKNVPSNKFLNKSFSQLWSNLKSVDSKTEKNFDYAFNILILKMLLQFLFVFLNHRLADQFGAFNPPFVNDYFVMLAQLNLIVFYGIIKRLVFLVAVFDIVDDLKQINWNSENLSACLKDLLVLLYNGFVLLL